MGHSDNLGTIRGWHADDDSWEACTCHTNIATHDQVDNTQDEAFTCVTEDEKGEVDVSYHDSYEDAERAAQKFVEPRQGGFEPRWEDRPAEAWDEMTS